MSAINMTGDDLVEFLQILPHQDDARTAAWLSRHVQTSADAFALLFTTARGIATLMGAGAPPTGITWGFSAQSITTGGPASAIGQTIGQMVACALNRDDDMLDAVVRVAVLEWEEDDVAALIGSVLALWVHTLEAHA